MVKEQITDKEAICTLILFLTGSTLIIGIGKEAKQDAWLVGIAGIVMALPLLFIYSRIASLFPGEDLFDILNHTLGKILGKVVAVLYIGYAFHLGALVLRNFGEFINTVTMPETPMLVPMLCLVLLCIVAVRSGIEVIARSTTYLLIPVLTILLIVLILAISQFDLDNLKPVLDQGLGSVLKGGFSALAFPFAEPVLFIGVFFTLKKRKSPYKVYFSGVLLAGFIIVTITLRNILILGEFLGSTYFPSHVAVSRISVGDFLQRIEVTVAFVFAVSAFTKCSVCLFVTAKGIGKLFNLKDYRSIVIQTGLLMVYFSYILYGSIMEMQEWALEVYPYYAFPFQVILPLILWIAAEIKVKKMKKSNA